VIVRILTHLGLPARAPPRSPARAQAFCPRCGSPIYSRPPGDDTPASYVVRVGTLRERDRLVPKMQNWTRSALPWIGEIGALRRNEKGAI